MHVRSNPAPAAISILLVDDHLMFRQGLVSLIEREPDLKVVKDVGDGATALDALLMFKPRVAVIDIGLPDMSGATLTRKIKNRLPSTGLVALSMHTEPHFIDLMLKEGASAYVLKLDAFEDLTDAIRSVAESSAVPFLSKSAKDILVATQANGGNARRQVLSRREEEVLRMMADGMKNRDIAEELKLSAKTVDTYRRRVMAKLGADSSADLVKSAIRLGLSSLT